MPFAKNYMIRTRLTTSFIAVMTFILAGLNLANAVFVFTFRDKANAERINAADIILFTRSIWGFSRLALISVVLYAVYSVLGAIVTAKLSFAQRIEITYAFFAGQVLLAVWTTVIGSYYAIKFHDFQATLQKLGGEVNFPYYNIMYYGSVAQAAYEPLVAVLAITWIVVQRHVPHEEEHMLTNRMG